MSIKTFKNVIKVIVLQICLTRGTEQFRKSKDTKGRNFEKKKKVRLLIM